MHASTFPLLALGSAVLAAPAARQIDQDLQNINYTVMALASATPVQYLSLNAHAGRFYLGTNSSASTTSYCPDSVESCPPGNVTVFKGSCALSAEDPEYWGVPEQTLWNTDDGVIGYDFSSVRPESAVNCPWYLDTPDNDIFAAELKTTYGANGFVACPTADDGTYQVLRSTDQGTLAAPLGDAADCIGITLVALQYNATEYGAFVYS